VNTGQSLWTRQWRGARIAAYRDGVVAVAEQAVMMLDAKGGTVWQAGVPAAVGGGSPDRLTVDGDTAYATFHDRPNGSEQVDVVAFALS
jgi:hypothetical protein